MTPALRSRCRPKPVNDRATIATRIIDLARSGVIDPAALHDRVLREVQAGGVALFRYTGAGGPTM